MGRTPCYDATLGSAVTMKGAISHRFQRLVHLDRAPRSPSHRTPLNQAADSGAFEGPLQVWEYQVERPPPCRTSSALLTSRVNVALIVLLLVPVSRTISRVVTRP